MTARLAMATSYGGRIPSIRKERHLALVRRKVARLVQSAPAPTPTGLLPVRERFIGLKRTIK